MSLLGFPAAFAKPYHVFLKPLRLQQNVAVKVFKSQTGGPLRGRVLNPYSALEKTQLYEGGPTLLTSTGVVPTRSIISLCSSSLCRDSFYTVQFAFVHNQTHLLSLIILSHEAEKLEGSAMYKEHAFH